MIPVFIGWDPRESINFAVLNYSLIKRCSQPISVIPLKLDSLDFYTETHKDGSTEFSYTRFLVPYLMNYNGWAIFMDCDIIAQTDIADLWSLRDPNYAVMCVQHDYKTSRSIKFLGNPNRDYARKNWSSVMLFNCSHPANSVLNPKLVQAAQGSWLHQFGWLDNDLIGELPKVWNWLADEYGENQSAKLIHYTLGSPCFKDYQDSPMADRWFAELNDLQLPSSTADQKPFN